MKKGSSEGGGNGDGRCPGGRAEESAGILSCVPAARSQGGEREVPVFTIGGLTAGIIWALNQKLGQKSSLRK
jgi:hypothetical protein